MLLCNGIQRNLRLSDLQMYLMEEDSKQINQFSIKFYETYALDNDGNKELITWIMMSLRYYCIGK